MSKIIEGCKAIIVSGIINRNVGKIVTVGMFIGKVKGYIGIDFWSVDKEIIYGYEFSKDKGICFIAHEKDLQRIDDDLAINTKEKLELEA